MRLFALMAMMGGILGCTDDKHCLSCNSERKCIVCSDAILTDAGVCDPTITLIPNCSLYARKPDGSIACNICTFGYREEKGVCEKCADTNCATCGANIDTCTSCFKGKLVKDGKCSDEQMENKQCYIPRDQDICNVCRPGLSIASNGDCLNGPKNCQIRSSSETCALCLDGTFQTPQGTCEGSPKVYVGYYTDAIIMNVNIAIALSAVIAVFAFLFCRRNKQQTDVSEPSLAYSS